MFLVDMNFSQIEKITPELTDQHRAHLAKEYNNGNLVFGGRKVPRTGGIILSRHETKDQLEQVLQSDPFIKSGLINYSITQFEPVMASTAFQSLLN